MSGEQTDPDVMVQWYRRRIAEPTTDDEVYGYWLFVFGILLGILGILLYLSSSPDPGSLPGKVGIGLSGVALVFVMIGPVIRLPLQRSATRLSYAGALVSCLGVVWFLAAYPGWRSSGTATPIIALYALGLVLIAVGAAFVPVIRSRSVEATEPVAEPAESQARFELYEDRAGEWRWRLLHENGQTMGDSGEGYASRTGAIDGIRSVKRNAPNAEADFLDGTE